MPDTVPVHCIVSLNPLGDPCDLTLKMRKLMHGEVQGLAQDYTAYMWWNQNLNLVSLTPEPYFQPLCSSAFKVNRTVENEIRGGGCERGRWLCPKHPVIAIFNSSTSFPLFLFSFLPSSHVFSYHNSPFQAGYSLTFCICVCYFQIPTFLCPPRSGLPFQIWCQVHCLQQACTGSFQSFIHSMPDKQWLCTKGHSKPWVEKMNKLWVLCLKNSLSVWGDRPVTRKDVEQTKCS